MSFSNQRVARRNFRRRGGRRNFRNGYQPQNNNTSQTMFMSDSSAGLGTIARRSGRETSNQNISGNILSSPFPALTTDRFFSRLKLSTTISYSGSPAGLNNIAGNDIFAPVGSVQPDGFDQLKLLYQRYRVWGSRIRVSILPASGETVTHISCLFPATVTGIITNADDAMVQPYAVSKAVIAYNPVQTELANAMSTSKIFGEPPLKVQYDDTYTGAVTGSPGFIWYWCFLVEAADGSTNIAGRINYYVEYDCEFYRRTTLFDA
jgi:hypothetical protein